MEYKEKSKPTAMSGGPNLKAKHSVNAMDLGLHTKKPCGDGFRGATGNEDGNQRAVQTPMPLADGFKIK